MEENESKSAGRSEAHLRLPWRISPGFIQSQLNPLGIVASALFFGALDNGSQAMQRTEGVSPVLVQVIQALVIMILLAFDTPAWTRLRAQLFARAPGESAVAQGAHPDA